MSEPLEVFQRVTELVNEGDFETLARDWMHPDFVRHDLAGLAPEMVGREEALTHSKALAEALQEVEVKIEDAFTDDDGKVAARFTVRGRFAGEIAEHPPTGEPFAINGMGMYRVEDSRLAEAWVLMDLFSIVNGTSGS